MYFNNSTDKMIAVVFRGSVNLKDWLMDMNFGKAVASDIVKEFTREDVRMHAGFTGEMLKLSLLFFALIDRLLVFPSFN